MQWKSESKKTANPLSANAVASLQNMEQSQAIKPTTSSSIATGTNLNNNNCNPNGIVSRHALTAEKCL